MSKLKYFGRKRRYNEGLRLLNDVGLVWWKDVCEVCIIMHVVYVCGFGTVEKERLSNVWAHGMKEWRSRVKLSGGWRGVGSDKMVLGNWETKWDPYALPIPSFKGSLSMPYFYPSNLQHHPSFSQTHHPSIKTLVNATHQNHLSHHHAPHFLTSFKLTLNGIFNLLILSPISWISFLKFSMHVVATNYNWFFQWHTCEDAYVHTFFLHQCMQASSGKKRDDELSIMWLLYLRWGCVHVNLGQN